MHRASVRTTRAAPMEPAPGARIGPPGPAPTLREDVGRLPPLSRTHLVLSNLFMTFARYAHLKSLGPRPWLVAALASWGIALSCRRRSRSWRSCPSRCSTSAKPVKLDYLWSALCVLSAAYFAFRS